MNREALCISLVRSGVATVRDNADHSAKPNRCMVESGACVGYYTLLSDYDAGTDTFGTGWKQRVPASTVDTVALWDLMELFKKLLQHLPGQGVSPTSAAEMKQL